MKKQSNLSRLMEYAEKHKILTYLSWVLSVTSALLALVPFGYIWLIIHDILEVSPEYICCGLYIRLDVLAHQRVPGGREYPKRTYAAYHNPAAWSDGKVWKREAATDRK